MLGSAPLGVLSLGEILAISNGALNSTEANDVNTAGFLYGASY